MNDDYTRGRLQDIEKHVRSLDGTVRVLASVDRPAVKKQIEETFADPRVVIIFRGVEEGLTQSEIAAELKRRGLTSATQSFVSASLAQLDERGFVTKPPKGSGYVPLDGWEAFNLRKSLRKILKAADIDDLS